MEEKAEHYPPRRVTDLIGLKAGGAEVTCGVSFEILPVDFVQRESRFQAHVFLCRYSGHIDHREYSFRKCYARGCPHNLCPHVSQAVMIANRYLQRDYVRLRKGGIILEEKMFTLEDMIVKFEDMREERGAVLTIHDYINIAREGNKVRVDMNLEYVPAVEHFISYTNSQTFLNVEFAVTCLGSIGYIERCLACYSTDHEKEEKQPAVEVANQRLKLLCREFDETGVEYTPQYFQ